MCIRDSPGGIPTEGGGTFVVAYCGNIGSSRGSGAKVRGPVGTVGLSGFIKNPEDIGTKA